MTTGRAPTTVISKVSVSVAPVWSLTRIVGRKTPWVVGRPVMPPELTPCVKSVIPGGIAPATTLNCTGFCDVLQPVVPKKNVVSVPTFMLTGGSGTIVQGVAGGGGGGGGGGGRRGRGRGGRGGGWWGGGWGWWWWGWWRRRWRWRARRRAAGE